MRERVGDDERVAEVFSAGLRVLEECWAELVEISDSHTGLGGLWAAENILWMTGLKAGLNAYLATTPPAVKTCIRAELITFNRTDDERDLRWFQQELFELSESQNGLDNPTFLRALPTSRQLAVPEGVDRLLAVHEVRFFSDPQMAPLGRLFLE